MDNIQDLCKKILIGEVSFSNVVRSEREKNIFCRNTNNFKLELSPQDVINFLQLYISNKKIEAEVKDWALFLLMTDAFSTPNIETDYFDSLWDIINELSCPEVDGKLTKERALNYISELKKL